MKIFKSTLSNKLLGRNFSTRQLNSWIKSDQLTNRQVRQIDEFIKRSLAPIQVLSPRQFWQSLNQ